MLVSSTTTPVSRLISGEHDMDRRKQERRKRDGSKESSPQRPFSDKPWNDPTQSFWVVSGEIGVSCCEVALDGGGNPPRERSW